MNIIHNLPPNMERGKFKFVIIGALLLMIASAVYFLNPRGLTKKNLAALPSFPSSCKTISYKNDPKKSLNIVFVGSGFEGDKESLKNVSEKMWSDMNSFSLYRQDLPINVFYSTVEFARSSFCKNNIPGIAPQFLICGPLRAKSLARVCPTSNQYIVVVHNSDDYAGAGLWNFKMATVSTHDFGSNIVAHELGHAIFGFGDEYKETNNFYSFASNSSNCDTQGCPKWRDLIRQGAPNLNVGCIPNSCTGGKFFASGATIMKDMVSPFSATQEREACCLFKSISGNYPPTLCSKFENAGMGLDNFCSQSQREASKKKLFSNQKFFFNLAERDWSIKSYQKTPAGTPMAI
ncbi:MAG TPA: M64 family metallopeptidase [Candidatus Paceibacterota bacterium]|nr:M64 family metallopeptidase [Candidatus Paceibacterota bacterium]